MGSLPASHIVGGNSTMERRKNDFYPTPPEVVMALLGFLRLPKETVIWECAAGEGDMVKAIKVCGYSSVYGTDISDGFDFLNPDIFDRLLAPFDWIITNPPFVLAEDFIRRAASTGKPFALLLKSQYWHAKGRMRLFEELPPSYILPLTWRPNFFFKDGGNSSPLMDMMWCVWLTPQIRSVQTVYKPLAKPEGGMKGEWV